MEKKNVGTFSILDVDTVEGADFSSTWYYGNKEKIKTRKYAQERLSEIFNRVYYWIGDNRERIRGLTLEQQEEIMIKEGIITRNDI